MSNLQLYNSLSRQKESFTPLDEKNVTMYVCGPTVYASPHLGNARSTVIYDLLYRVLKELYPQVTYVRNITDVDDKINQAALAKEISIAELTTEVLEEFQSDMLQLNNLAPTFEPKVTEHITEITDLVSKLIEQGYAYESAGHVYFAVNKFKEYGKLSGRKIEDLLQGARIEISDLKKAPEDFVLWKPAKDTDDVSAVFESPWSKGRPGWHIECSALSTKYLGKDFDIHGGGADLKFPHHENEIAQSCAAHPDAQYANFWVHNGFLTVNGEKMSKSLGNFITVKEILSEGVSGRVLRYIFLSTHYRKPLDYNFKILEEARKNIARIDNILEKFSGEIDKTQPLPAGFLAPLCDDLNISEAMAYLFALLKELNSNDDAEKLQEFVRIVDFLGFATKSKKVELPAEISDMAKQIQNARMNKDYQLADQLRDKIIELGYELSYAKGGEVIVKPKS